MQVVSQALYACLPWRCPVPRGAKGMGAIRERTYRLYTCQRCGQLVRICQRCDHGNIYCAGQCARLRRQASIRRAQARYQRTRRGAARHAARQRAYRQRRKVTHQGFSKTVIACIVVVSPSKASRTPDVHHATSDQCSNVPHGSGHCAFCGRRLPEWARQRPWRWSS
jgi:hypothetical protein